MKVLNMYQQGEHVRRAMCVWIILLLSLGIFAQTKNSGYSLKEGKVYFLNEEIEQADPKSFIVLSHGYAKDKNNVYFKGGILQYVDPTTFKLKGAKDKPSSGKLDSGYYKTENEVFYNGKRVKGVFTIRDFRDLGDGYAIDTFNAYYEGVEIQGTHSSGFKNLGDGYAIDTFNAYYEGLKIQDAHSSGFKNLGKGYAKDSFNTYYLGKKVER